jgi:hypothetical protein
MDFPSIQADVVTKVEPTKVNLVSHMYMIQCFVSEVGNLAIFQLYHGKNKLIFNEMMSALN